MTFFNITRISSERLSSLLRDNQLLGCVKYGMSAFSSLQFDSYKKSLLWIMNENSVSYERVIFELEFLHNPHNLEILQNRVQILNHWTYNDFKNDLNKLFILK